MSSESELRERSMTRTLPEAAAQTLLRHRLPLVIDDFHHLPRNVQADVIGALKDLVFEGLPVILAAVPHRLADAVRSAPEMNGRVEHLAVGLWTPEELKNIALKGFGPEGLNAICGSALADALANNSARSPHLMQQLCRELARDNDIHEVLTVPQELKWPEQSWEVFNGSIAAARTSDVELAALFERDRDSARKRWRTPSGDELDLNGLLLLALARAWPRPQVSLEELCNEIAGLVPRDPPSREDCSTALIGMAAMAEEMATGPTGERSDPVLEYDHAETRRAKVHVLDPFFAFRLRWAPPFSGAGPPTPEDLAFEQLERLRTAASDQSDYA